MQKLFIPLLLGTAREGRESEKVARFVFNQISTDPEIEVEFIDVRDFLFGKTVEYGTIAEPWKKIMEKADGLIIVSPEYNRSIPGELKILIDSIDKEYNKKPVALVGVSSGRLGGGRMVENFLPTLVALGMVPLSPTALFPKSAELFKPDGSFTDEFYTKKIAEIIGELKSLARLLKEARSNHA